MSYNRLYIITLAVLLAFSCVNAVRAKELASATVQMRLTIIKGETTISATTLNFNTIDLNKGSSARSENVITVNNSSGSGAGWHVTIRSTDIVSTTGKQIPLESTDFVVKNITGDRISGASGDTNFPQGMGGTVRLSRVDQKILIARENAGMGKFLIKPEYEITVPPDSQSGNYSSNVTYTLYQGP